MKAIQVVKPGEMKMIEVEKPGFTDDYNVIIKMKAAGICGSDMGIYHGTNAAATYPRIIGHEIVGVVDEVRDDVTKVKVGDRVIVDQVTACGECYACKHGRPNVCGNLKVRGVHIEGGYREYLACNESDCYLLPDFLPDKDAIMIEPTTIAVQSMSRAQIEEDDSVLIIGAGALGSSILRICKTHNPKQIIVSDVLEDKLQEALDNGATHVINAAKEDVVGRCKELTDGYGVTLTIDAACIKGSLLTACQATGNAGRVITMGFSVASDEINQFVITSKELDVRGSRLQNRKFQEVIDLVNSKQIDLVDTVSHTFPFEKFQEAFDFMDSHDPSIRKIALTFDD